MKRYMILLTTLISLANTGEFKAKCFAYDTDNFTLEMFQYNNGHREKLALESLKIYYIDSKKEPYPITVGYNVNGHEYFNTDVYCTINKEEKMVWCGIECDGGGFEIRKGFAIQVQYLALYRDDPNEDSGIEKALFQKDKSAFIQGQAFDCPQNIPVSKMPDSAYYEDDPAGRYVCYEYKYKGKYEGCFRTKKSCKALHLQHFGKYLTQNESKKALNRCQTSTANKDYVDNKNGLYVCYDYKDTRGEYSGCFRSTKACSLLKKEHFGKYPNKNESQKAFQRCRRSTPRK